MFKENKMTLLILDIDNTINNKNSKGEIGLVASFKELHKRIDLREDIKVAYNTTRGISRVLEILHEEQDFFGNGIISALNGGLIYDLKEKKQILSHNISLETRVLLSNWFKENEDITFMAFYADDDIFGHVFLKEAREVDDFFKLHELSFNHKKGRCIADKEIFASWIEGYEINMIEYKTANAEITNKSLSEDENINFSYDGHYYINAKGVNKKSGISDLKKILFKEVRDIEIIVAGDSKTDLVMFDDFNLMNIAVGEKIQVPNKSNYKNVKDPEGLCNLLSELLKL